MTQVSHLVKKWRLEDLNGRRSYPKLESTKMIWYDDVVNKETEPIAHLIIIVSMQFLVVRLQLPHYQPLLLLQYMRMLCQNHCKIFKFIVIYFDRLQFCFFIHSFMHIVMNTQKSLCEETCLKFLQSTYQICL